MLMNLQDEIQKIRSYLSYLSGLPEEALPRNSERVSHIVSEYLENRVRQEPLDSMKAQF